MNTEEQSFTDPEMLRRKAEELLKSKQKRAELSIKETDPKKLLHELQVHQIELEMQNEELRQANEVAELALEKFTMLYDLSPMGYFTLDIDGTICELNFTAADLLGEKRFSLINSNFKLFVSKESKVIFNEFLAKVFSGNVKESCNIRLGYDGKPLSYVYIEGIVTGDERNCLLSVVDISKIKKQNI